MPTKKKKATLKVAKTPLTDEFLMTLTCSRCGKRMNRDGDELVHPVVATECDRAGNRYVLPVVSLEVR